MEAVTKERMRELGRIKQRLQLGGGGDRLEKEHKSGKLSARERLDLLLDRKSFREAGLFAKHNGRLFGMGGKELPADGVVTGRGRIDGRLVHVASQDFTVAGGSAGEVHAGKIADTMTSSLKTGSPFVFINDSGGARVQEGVASLAGYARIFYQNVMLSGVVPQISLICGPCAGGAAYSPALTDFIIQTHDAQMFITGPAVIKQVTGEIVAPDDLGGPRAPMNKSGVVHFVAENDVEAVKICQRLLSFLPNNKPGRAAPPGSRRRAARRRRTQRYRARRIQERLRRKEDRRARGGSRRFSGGAVRFRQEPGGGLRAHPRTLRGRGCQPAVGAGWSARHRRLR